MLHVLIFLLKLQKVLVKLITFKTARFLFIPFATQHKVGILTAPSRGSQAHCHASCDTETFRLLTTRLAERCLLGQALSSYPWSPPRLGSRTTAGTALCSAQVPDPSRAASASLYARAPTHFNSPPHIQSQTPHQRYRNSHVVIQEMSRQKNPKLFSTHFFSQVFPIHA